MSAIELDSVTKVFPDGTVAVDQLTLKVESGETMALIGPSGCGKTTTLRLLAGLEQPTAGTIRLDQRDVTRVDPACRNVAMMFQSDALYPHMNVRDNLSFGLRSKTGFWKRAFGFRSGGANKSPGQIEESVGKVAGRLGIEELLDRKPHQLSGGERQRVALGRAMVREPAAFLLDEPLSRLDARLADELRNELRQVFHDLGKPVVYVTHDQREAMSLSDRLAVMDRGRVLQVGKPLDVYRRPASLFVANFVGSVPVNVLPLEAFKQRAPDGAVSLGVRAEDVAVAADESDGADRLRLRAVVRDVQRLGDHSLVRMEIDELKGSCLIARGEAEAVSRPGDRVQASVQGKRLLWFDASGTRIESSSG